MHGRSCLDMGIAWQYSTIRHRQHCMAKYIMRRLMNRHRTPCYCMAVDEVGYSTLELLACTCKPAGQACTDNRKSRYGQSHFWCKAARTWQHTCLAVTMYSTKHLPGDKQAYCPEGCGTCTAVLNSHDQTSDASAWCYLHMAHKCQDVPCPGRMSCAAQHALHHQV